MSFCGEVLQNKVIAMGKRCGGNFSSLPTQLIDTRENKSVNTRLQFGVIRSSLEFYIRETYENAAGFKNLLSIYSIEINSSAR